MGEGWLSQNEQFFSYIMAKIIYIRWDDDDDVDNYNVCIVLDQQS